MPPDTVKSASPSVPPLHNTFVPVIFADNGAAGSVIVTHTLSEHKLSSVTVTQYVPAARLLISLLVSFVLHK
ncbi:hypothetical protein ES703_103175 [subsurface metagenome]